MGQSGLHPGLRKWEDGEVSLISAGVAEQLAVALTELWKMRTGDRRGLRAEGNQSSVLEMISLRCALDIQVELPCRSAVIGFTSLEPKGQVTAGGRKFTVIHI